MPGGLSFFLRDGVGERGGGVLNGNEGWRTGVKDGFESMASKGVMESKVW